MIPRADYHTHTFFSHGKGTPEENVCAAVKKGLKTIAISEHGPAHLTYGVKGEKLKALRREIDRLNRVYGRDIQVLMGIEANLYGDGRCELEFLDRAMFDVCILGYHKGVWPKDRIAAHCCLEVFKLGKPHPEETALALLHAAERFHIQILSHPCLYTKADMGILGKGSAELGVLLELNAHHMVLDPAEIRQAADKGARFIFGSDAHHPKDVAHFEEAMAAAEAAGVLDRVTDELPY